ncbi:hypothetical protein NEOLI_003943 [Neolecta irregularis DAH-3]|uniref:Uncharacterized protein n=1 Tax=Neolecta irregularis (strain DAH-3) TaxID=1198029 RepID=A0A1U7LQ47_NEOID|nr:hypothetical protein NEOLI_003943 [Neolecta irregularis DAH-3]|eukprot:OLL24785.1 hypothetical protein NEOLI_003943 [Neolecta irregularis DAH-3]
MSQISFSPPLGSNTLVFSKRLKFVAFTPLNDIQIDLYSNVNDQSNWSPNPFSSGSSGSIPDYSTPNVVWHKHTLDLNLPDDRGDFEFTARHKLANTHEIFWNGFFTNGRITRDWKGLLHAPILSYFTMIEGMSRAEVHARILARLLAGISDTEDLDPASLQVYKDIIHREELSALEDSVSVDEFKARFTLVGDILVIRGQNSIVGLFNTSDDEQAVLFTDNLLCKTGRSLYSRLLQSTIHLPRSFDKMITLPGSSFEVLTVVDDKPVLGHILKCLGFVDKVFLFSGIEERNMVGNELHLHISSTGRLGFQVNSKFNSDDYILKLDGTILHEKAINLINFTFFIDIVSPGTLTITEKPQPKPIVTTSPAYGFLIILLFAGIGIGLAVGKYTFDRD